MCGRISYWTVLTRKCTSRTWSTSRPTSAPVRLRTSSCQSLTDVARESSDLQSARERYCVLSCRWFSVNTAVSTVWLSLSDAGLHICPTRTLACTHAHYRIFCHRKPLGSLVEQEYFTPSQVERDLRLILLRKCGSGPTTLRLIINISIRHFCTRSIITGVCCREKKNKILIICNTIWDKQLMLLFFLCCVHVRIIMPRLHRVVGTLCNDGHCLSVRLSVPRDWH